MRPQQAKGLLWAVGGVYAALVLTCAAQHEAWFDEAQSWLLARDLGPWELVSRFIRYEGTPPLWQLILMPFAKGGFPYSALSFVSAALGIGGVALFLWRSPFPVWFKILFPFGYFPLFQYAVVARSYALYLPILCGVAICFRERVGKRAVAYCGLLSLLALVSLHGALIAAVLFAEWLWSAWAAKVLRQRWPIVVGFAALYGAIFLMLRLPPDLIDRSAGAHSAGAMVTRVLKQISEAFWGGLGNNAYRVFSTLVGVVVLIVSFVSFRHSTARWFLLGIVVPLLLLAGWKQGAPWHAGIIYLGWMFCLWIFFEQRPNVAAHSRTLTVVAGVVLAAQAWFGLRSVWFDDLHVFSASREAAEYLQTHQKADGKLYDIGYKSFALQPYFRHNLFAAQEHGRTYSFYSWKNSLDHDRYDDLQEQKPDRIILSDYTLTGALRQLGYCEETRFQGAMWWKNAKAEPDTYVILARCPVRAK